VWGAGECDLSQSGPGGAHKSDPPGGKSARCVAGWGWWSLPVGRRSGIEPASSTANLGMWVRERWFPATYAHATWHRLVPFFRLPGRVTEGKQTVWVELRPFHDRQLNLTCLTDDDSASPSQEQGVSVQMVNRAKWRESLILWLKGEVMMLLKSLPFFCVPIQSMIHLDTMKGRFLHG
jgi:hypothetical protein